MPQGYVRHRSHGTLRECSVTLQATLTALHFGQGEHESGRGVRLEVPLRAQRLEGGLEGDRSLLVVAHANVRPGQRVEEGRGYRVWSERPTRHRTRKSPSRSLEQAGSRRDVARIS